MPPFYPQLSQADSSSFSDIEEFPNLRPNFNNDGVITTPRPTRSTYKPEFSLDQGLGQIFHQHNHDYYSTTPRPSPVNSSLTASQWNQILSKLNFALEKLSKLEETTKSSPSKEAISILDNPHYLNNDHPKSASSSVSSNGVKINILTYDDKEYDEDHDINYEDYFQAIADVDNLNLENDTPNPSSIQDDYVYFNDDIIDQFFTFDIPQDVPRPLDLPGVGSRNPVPLSDFPRYDSKIYIIVTIFVLLSILIQNYQKSDLQMVPYFKT